MIQTTFDDRPEIGRLADFELGTRSTDYKPISWAKLKARAKKEQTDKNPRAMMLEVFVKPSLSGKWVEGLYQEFGLDDKAAIKYAESLIRDGLADSVWISCWYSRPFGFMTRTGYRREGPITISLVLLERI